MMRWSGVAGCDKSLPGMMMAMLRLNVPSVFLYGGSIMPGSFEGRDVTVLDVFEAVGAHAAGSNEMSDDKLRALEKGGVPGRWRLRRPVHRQYDGLCQSKRLAWHCRLSSALPAPWTDRDGYARAVRQRWSWTWSPRILRPREICTREAFENAAIVVAATGGSTNAALHLPAMAHECGVEFTLRHVAEVFSNAPPTLRT